MGMAGTNIIVWNFKKVGLHKLYSVKFILSIKRLKLSLTRKKVNVNTDPCERSTVNG